MGTSLLVGGVVFGVALSTPAQAQDAALAAKIKKMQSLTQARGYLKAHMGVKAPLPLLGGPLRVSISQTAGGVFVALPDHRRLDPRVFGPPGLPRHYAGTPVITGVPGPLRVKGPDGSLQTQVMTPFGDKHIVMGGGKLHIDAVDATATDAATTQDTVKMQASWKDKAGNTYSVKCCMKMAAHGVEFPTFGGVVTNVILHGFTGLGTPLMPSEFTQFAFWGMGQVEKNGKVLDKPRLIHGMLTEYVRKEGYKLAFDSEVTPTRTHFHLMVPPMKPDPAKGIFTKAPVHTGMQLPNGMTLPFWHVMFEALDVEAHRG
ncbi:MAG: hypothetical protein ACE5IL_13520 [Myxococcota bacterium]